MCVEQVLNICVVNRSWFCSSGARSDKNPLTLWVPQGGMSVDSITDLDDNQSRLLEALQLSLPAETPSKKEKHRDKRLSLNPIYRQVPRVVDSCCQHIEKFGEYTLCFTAIKHTYITASVQVHCISLMKAESALIKLTIKSICIVAAVKLCRNFCQTFVVSWIWLARADVSYCDLGVAFSTDDQRLLTFVCYSPQSLSL